jgi:cbb3-type cytochrome oxidase maturation protein
VSAVFVVLPLALIVVLAAVAAFGWAARRGQFDDLETPALRMLHDDEVRRPVSPPGERAEEGAGDEAPDGEPPSGGSPSGPAPPA